MSKSGEERRRSKKKKIKKEWQKDQDSKHNQHVDERVQNIQNQTGFASSEMWNLNERSIKRFYINMKSLKEQKNRRKK